MNSGSAIGITQGAFITLQDSTQGAGFLAPRTELQRLYLQRSDGRGGFSQLLVCAHKGD